MVQASRQALETMVRGTYRRTEGVGVSEEMIFMLVLWSTLGRCWMVSWVRGETGECWWLWEWEDERLLDCSVPGESTRKGFFSSVQQP